MVYQIPLKRKQRASPSVKEDMVLLFILWPFFVSTAESRQDSQERWERSWDYYHGQGAGLIEWEGLDPLRWLNLDVWKKGAVNRDNYYFWKEIYRQRRLKEVMGRVLGCVGRCRSFRGEGYANVSWRSSIVEGDDLETMEDSYAWVFLYDGTMARLSPKTTVTFKEINIGTHEIFLHARINHGNVLWLSRDPSGLKKDLRRETDTLFLPLEFYEANQFHRLKEASEDNLFAMVDDYSFIEQKYERLNALIEKNNKMVKERNTYSFITFPNGTVWGSKLKTEFIILPGIESYVKNRTFHQLGLERENNSEAPYFYYRGYENEKKKKLDFGKWYKVSADGKEIEFLDENENIFGLGEFVTRRIPTLLMGREMMLQRYSNFVFDNKLDSIALALDHGYRLWGRISAPILKEDLEKRFLFLLEYTRKQETTGLLQVKLFRERLIGRGEKLSIPVYDHSFYQKALESFARYREVGRDFLGRSQLLNSTQRKSWRRMQVKKR